MFFKPTDDRLMSQVSQGDAQAFRELYDRHGARVLGYCRRFLADSQKGEDLAQEVWMKIIAAADRYRPEQKFISWALTIARRSGLDELRKRRNSDSPLEEASGLEESALQTDSFLEGLEASENIAALRAAIDELPEQQRIVLVLWMTHEWSYEEISHETGFSVASVKSSLFRARQGLERKFGAKS